MAAERLLTFQLARHRWGFSLADLAGVVEMPPLRSLPGLGAPFLGLAQRHGRIVTVLDLPALLDDPARAAAPASLLLLAPPRAHLALRVTAELRLLVRDPSGSTGSRAEDETPLRRIDLVRVLAALERPTAGA